MREAAVVMAAGKGTRMNSDLPKVCHAAAGKPLVQWAVEACRAGGIDEIIVIVGYRADLVRDALAGFEVAYATQQQQLGTGHAAMQARQVLGAAEARLFVVNGDMPLLDAATIRAMRQAHLAAAADMTLVSAVPSQPLEYGRVIHGPDGGVIDVIEERDCSPQQKALRELNLGFYVFNAPAVWPVFESLGNENKAGEYYITDMARAYARRGGRVTAVAVPEIVGSGVNTPEQLAWIDGLLRERMSLEQRG